MMGTYQHLLQVRWERTSVHRLVPAGVGLDSSILPPIVLRPAQLYDSSGYLSADEGFYVRREIIDLGCTLSPVSNDLGFSENAVRLCWERHGLPRMRYRPVSYTHLTLPTNR